MNTPQEASSDSRVFAHAIHDLYVAMLAEGFSQAEALMMLANIVAASIREQAGNDK